MKVYHICAMDKDQQHYFDGVFNIDTNVDFMIPEQYYAVKDQIGAKMTPVRKGKDLIILSLTLIG